VIFYLLLTSLIFTKMKHKSLILALSVMLFTLPNFLRAEEVEIPLNEVVSMTPIPGDDPLDDEGHMGHVPPRPNDFHAVHNGNTLSITRQNSTIPSAHATVVKVSNGSIVLNQQFTESLSEQIPASGTYVLHIQTDGGALVGQFMIP